MKRSDRHKWSGMCQQVFEPSGFQFSFSIPAMWIEPGNREKSQAILNIFSGNQVIEFLGFVIYLIICEKRDANSGGLSENSRKALLLQQNWHKTPRACVQTK